LISLTAAQARGVDLEVRRGGSSALGLTAPANDDIRRPLDLIRPDGGTLRVLGHDPQRVCRGPRESAIYLAAGIDESFTVEQHLFQCCATIANWAYVRAGRSDESRSSTAVQNLSKGIKQSGILQALMPRPALLMPDEPTSGLDPLIQQQVLRHS
jgi:ABC-2 type transport system ATP-binding protein